MSLDDIADSGQLFQSFGLIVERFAGPYLKECCPTASPDWLFDLPGSVLELHRVLTRWEGLVHHFTGGYGTQDSIFLPPKRVKDGEFLLIEENQGGFSFHIKKSGQSWIGTRHEVSQAPKECPIPGYLISFALQELIMSAPLWAIDEGLDGYSSRMMADLTLIWSDAKHGGYTPHHEVRYYWHSAGAIVACDERGWGHLGCHDLQLTAFFESFGFYDIR